MYQIQFETRARKEFFGLPKSVILLLTDVFEDLQKNPRPPGAKKLTGLEGYRLRKGDYRVLYTIDDKAKLLSIYRVGHRREIYR